MRDGWRISVKSGFMALLMAMAAALAAEMPTKPGQRIIKGTVMVTTIPNPPGAIITVWTENDGRIEVPKDRLSTFANFNGKTVKIVCNVAPNGDLQPVDIAKPEAKKADSGDKGSSKATQKK